MSGLEVVDYTKAYNGKRLKKEVYGIVSKDHAFIFKNIIDSKRKRSKKFAPFYCVVGTMPTTNQRLGTLP